MKIRFGYVATTLNLKKCSPSKTVTVTNLNKLPDNETKLNKLRRLAKENLTNTLRILRYNIAHDIFVYRFTSRLIPLATHPDIKGWDYVSELKEQFEEIGEFVKKHDIRVSAHPDHFTLINSPEQKVIDASFKDLQYHDDVFNAMGLETSILVMHVGGLYNNREASLQRFKDNFPELTESIKSRIALENDDKSYSIKHILPLCEEFSRPMVLDVHHHNCCNNGEDLLSSLPKIFETWNGERPKVHMSSPKSEKKFRHHADDVDPGEFIDFLKLAKELDKDFDVMIEAKNKDTALFNLMKELSKIPEIKIINQASIKY